MARKKKRLRPGSTTPAAKTTAPTTVEAESVETDSVETESVETPTQHDVESEESPTLASPPPSETAAAATSDTGSSDQPLTSTAASPPAAGSLTAERDGHTATEASEASEASEAVDDAAAAPSSGRPADRAAEGLADADRAAEGLADADRADGGLADEGLPNDRPDQGPGAELTDDAVVTEAVSPAQVHEPFPPQPVEDAHATRPLQAPHSYDEPFPPQPVEDAHATRPLQAPHSSDEPFSSHPVEDATPSGAMAAGQVRERLPAAPDREPFASYPVDGPAPTETLPADHVHEPAPVEPDHEGSPTRPGEEPHADEHESAQEPALAAAPAPDLIEDRAALTSESSTDDTPEEPVGGPVGKPVEGVAAWRRLLRMGLPRATKANVLGGLLAVLLGLAIATQVQLTQERGLSQLSQTDLIRVLDDVSLRSSRLDAQLRELEATRDRLRSGTGSSAEALAQAQKRVDTLGILAGTVAATGPGVVITLDDPEEALTGPIILDLIQELRDAGAEAIDVGGVRVVASSFVAEVDGDIAIDDTRVTRPIAIKAIGDAKTLSSAMTIPGGIVETVRQKNATARVVEQETIEITSLHTAQDLKNARVVE